ncbi:transcriptional regulator [Aquimarina algiphila]|uniref:hypothetical protein n=1 Tax=Aquimarina algiphila TaxID=2047982 RepID=UPI0023302A61|nr:hypothetical protein [Aquimarina algiphila]
MENNNDEIDLMQIFSMIKGGFRNFLKLIITVIAFYKKKAILFLILLIVGGGIGFFIDQSQDSKNEYIQEIIIEPKYNSVKYIYDFIDELEDNLKDEVFLSMLGITEDDIENVNKVEIEPVVKGTDVLDNLEERYENREFFKDIMEAYDGNQVEEEKFRDFYKHHKLIIEFNVNNEASNKIASSILNYIKSNKYYQDISKLTLKQKKTDLERNKTSLEFIDAYLKNLEKSPLNTENEPVVLSSRKDLPMLSIASLLQKKELLMELINKQERILTLDQEVFSFVYYGDIISKQKKLLNRTMFMIPLLLIGLVSFFYFSRYLSKSVKNFVNDEE